MSVPTTRQRIFALTQHLRTEDEELLSALLGIDPADVAATLASPSHTPTDPSGASAAILATQQPGNYSFAIADANTIIESQSAAPVNFTIQPHSTTPIPVGTIIEVFQDGTGQVSIVPGAGVTVLSNGAHTKTSAQYSTIGLRQRAQDEWVLSGDLA